MSRRQPQCTGGPHRVNRNGACETKHRLDTGGHSSETVRDEVPVLVSALAFTADPERPESGRPSHLETLLSDFGPVEPVSGSDLDGAAEDQHEETEFVRNFDPGSRFLSVAGDC